MTKKNKTMTEQLTGYLTGCEELKIRQLTMTYIYKVPLWHV